MATRISYTRWLRTLVVATTRMESHNSKKELLLQWNRWVQAAWKLHSSAIQDDASKNLICQPAGKSVPYLHSWQSTFMLKQFAWTKRDSTGNETLENWNCYASVSNSRLWFWIICPFSVAWILQELFRNIQRYACPMRKTCEQIHTIFATITCVPNSYQIIPIPQLMSAFHHQRTKNSWWFFQLLQVSISIYQVFRGAPSSIGFQEPNVVHCLRVKRWWKHGDQWWVNMAEPWWIGTSKLRSSRWARWFYIATKQKQCIPKQKFSAIFFMLVSYKGQGPSLPHKIPVDG